MIPAMGRTGHEKQASLGQSRMLAAVLRRLSSSREVSLASHVAKLLRSRPSWSTVTDTADRRRVLKATASFVLV